VRTWDFRAWRGTRLADAGVDEGCGISADPVGEPPEVPPVRIEAGAAGIQSAAKYAAGAGGQVSRESNPRQFHP
jgi:hypothetical protein